MYRGRAHALRVVRVERARRDAGGAVLGHVARALGGGAARVPTVDRARVRRDTARRLDEHDLDLVALSVKPS